MSSQWFFRSNGSYPQAPAARGGANVREAELNDDRAEENLDRVSALYRQAINHMNAARG